MNWHIIPSNDIQEHTESVNCHCSPACREIDGGGFLITHNSFDGREVREEAKEYINKFKN